MAQQTLTPPVARAANQDRETVREASPGLILLGRCGLLAKGTVYVLIGVAAARAAFGTGDQTIDSHGALGRIVEMPGPLLSTLTHHSVGATRFIAHELHPNLVPKAE